MSASWTFAAAAVNDYHKYYDADEHCSQNSQTAQNRYLVKFVIIGIFTFEQNLLERLGAGNHTFIPLVIGKVTVHVAFLYALAQSVRQHAFNAVTCDKLDAALAGAEQNDQTVV